MAPKTSHRILIVDDEPDILELLQYNLEKEGYEVETAGNGKKGVEVAKLFKPHLILMDIMMPELDGVEACRQIREVSTLKETFIIFLTARAEEYSEIAAFDAGASDYITKPIKPRALLSRISAVFRRTNSASKENNKLVYGDLVIDRGSYTVTLENELLVMPKKEFELLNFLAQNPNKVFSRDELLQNIWGTDVYVLARTVDVHVRKVREKIGDHYITTIKGVGYKFETSEPPKPVS